MCKIKVICLIISIAWIGLGTIVQLSGYPAYNYLGFAYDSFIYKFLWWVTLPSNILLFALLYADTLNNIYVLVILLQSIKVLIYWWIGYKISARFKKIKLVHNDKVKPLSPFSARVRI